MIRKYTASADTTIVNAFQPNLQTRGTGANMGMADVMEVFSIYGRQTPSSSAAQGSQELSRLLIKFPLTGITEDRTAGLVPASGSVRFILRLYNAQIAKTVPRDYKLVTYAVSQSWEEGVGLDLEGYKDYTKGNTGANWIDRISADVPEITKLVFGSDTPDDYAAGSGENYVKLYDTSTRYNFWFKDTGADTLPSADGTEIRVDINGLGSAAAIAGVFQATASAQSGFSANIDGATVYVTASTSGSSTNTGVEGTLSDLTITTPQDGGFATRWQAVGGSYLTGGSYPFFEQSFETGLEDLQIDITSLIESWIAGTYENYGMGVHLSNSYEAYFSGSDGENSGSVLNITDGATKSYYTKRFFARGSQYWFKRPRLEARWDSTFRDNRGDFYYSASAAPAADNLNTIYLYNYVRGRLVNIPNIGVGNPYVSLYSGSSDNSAPTGSKLSSIAASTPVGAGAKNITGAYVSTGIYSCDIGIASSSITHLFDVWHDGTTEYFTGSIVPVLQTGEMTRRTPIYYLNITNLQNEYRADETARMYLYVRDKNWNPTIYTQANTNAPTTAIQSASYRVYRVLDGYPAIPHGTGSNYETGLSYDVSGNYFDLNMKMLEPGYEYGVKFAFYNSELSTWSEQDETFKFRVENYEY
jgi:hypothetical protein